MLGGIDINLPPTNIPMEGLSEEEQMALALKASMDRIREEQATQIASFIYD